MVDASTVHPGLPVLEAREPNVELQEKRPSQKWASMLIALGESARSRCRGQSTLFWKGLSEQPRTKYK